MLTHQPPHPAESVILETAVVTQDLVVDVAVAAVAERPKRRNGSPSPSSAVS